MKRFSLVFVIALALGLNAFGQEIGKPLPPWKEGMLDVHHINTGRGDAADRVLTLYLRDL